MKRGLYMSPGRFSNCNGYGMSIFIGISYDKIFKIKAGIEKLLLIEGVFHPRSVYFAYLIFLIRLYYYLILLISAAVESIFYLREIMIIDMRNELGLIWPRKINNTGVFLYVMNVRGASQVL